MLMGDNQAPVTGFAPNFDTSAAGKALAKLYAPCVQTVGRQFQWDMARSTVSLSATGSPPSYAWQFEYFYPTNGIEVWQVMPQTFDPNNPLPSRWTIGNAILSGQQQRVVRTNFANAVCVYNNSPNENTWDSLFREAVVRLLASELALAIAGKPDVAQALVETGSAFETIAEGRSG